MTSLKDFLFDSFGQGRSKNDEKAEGYIRELEQATERNFTGSAGLCIGYDEAITKVLRFLRGENK